MAEHSTLTGANLHEPKGVAAATVNQIYISDGAGSGAWTDLTTTLGSYVLNVVIADISTAETILIPVPLAGTVTAVTSVLEGAITVADATITVSDSLAASMGTLTVAFTGSAAGDIDTLVPSANNVITANDYITVATDGGSTTAQRVWVSIVIER